MHHLMQRFPTWGTWEIWRVLQKFKVIDENAIKYPLSSYEGVREFSFYCMGVREHKKVWNRWSNANNFIEDRKVKA